MGRDKHENEDLIRWAFPEDVWFHVDKMSSAHVYLRMRKGETLDDIPQVVLEDCAQLVKANSIQGTKMNDIVVVYTLASNLKKTADMDVGQVGFHKQKEVRSIAVEKKVNEIVNRLNKTKEEKSDVDFRGEREERDRLERLDEKKRLQERKQQEKEEQRRKEEERQARSYDSLMKPENMQSNYGVVDDDDDFM